MGCDRYYFEDIPISFSEMDDEIGCLCLWNGEGIDDKETVIKLAYLGAAVVLIQHGIIDSGYIPNCLPAEVIRGIDEVLGQ